MPDSVFFDGSVRPTGHYLPNPEEREVFRLFNLYRASLGVGPLAIAGALQAIATWVATDKLLNPALPKSHDDSLGRTFGQRIAIGYNVNAYAGEILAWYYDTPAAVVQGWKSSPGHNAAIIDPAYKYIGLCLRRDAGLEYWVAEFGSVRLDQPTG